MNIQLPEKVSFIIDTLNNAGYEAYAVGGCVRDTLLGRVPDDWDITTSAMPLETKALFNRTIDTGIKHGTVTIMLGKEGFEVTTYRVDGAYTDSRHPDSVSFTRSLAEDLRRRDFTINAMAYCFRDGLQDLFCGIDDLEAGIVRCVGDPKERFSEDALRILRAVRFSAQLGFTIDEATRQAASGAAHTLVNISAERIHTELDKLLKSGHPDYLAELSTLGLDSYIFPELKALRSDHPGDFDRLMTLLALSPADRLIRWALVLSYTGHSSEVMHRLKFDNASIYMVNLLIANRNEPAKLSSSADLRRLMFRIGADMVPLLLDFCRSCQPDFSTDSLLALYEGVLSRQEATSLKQLAVNGRDLIGLGFPPGNGIGDTLDYLMSKVLDQPGLNDRQTLLEIAEQIKE